jgi:hypothetical protein
MISAKINLSARAALFYLSIFCCSYSALRFVSSLLACFVYKVQTKNKNNDSTTQQYSSFTIAIIIWLEVVTMMLQSAVVAAVGC